MKSTPLHTSYNEDLLAILPKGLARVVEIGCSNGKLAQAYLAENPKCEYLGVEVSEEYAQRAREFIRVRVGDVETFTENDLQEFGQVDCWILGDVLEHLRDPWELLRKLRGIVGKGAVLAMCVPNMQHWSIFRALLSGNLFYTQAGLLDITHLRWFTGKTLVQSLEATGWEPIAGKARVFQEPPEAHDFVSKLGGFAAAVGMDPDSVMNHAQVYQYVVLARPS